MISAVGSLLASTTIKGTEGGKDPRNAPMLLASLRVGTMTVISEEFMAMLDGGFRLNEPPAR